MHHEMRLRSSSQRQSIATATAEKVRRFTLIDSFYVILILVLATCLSALVRYPGLQTQTIRAVIKHVATDTNSSPETYRTLIDSFSPRVAVGPKLGPNFVVLLTCSDGFFEMWLNWLAFFERLLIPNLPVYLFAEDHTTYGKCNHLAADKKANVEDGAYTSDLVCLSWETVFPEVEVKETIGAKGYRTIQYIRMMSHRPAIIQYLLERGHDVIFSDVDVVWQKNPLTYFQSDYSSVNIWAQTDLPLKGAGKRNRPSTNLCPGFMIYRTCDATIAFVDLWRSELEGKEERNQAKFNYLLSEAARNGFEIVAKALPEELFTTGSLFFEQFTDDERANAVVVHNNGISGYENKLDRMKKFGLWIGEREQMERQKQQTVSKQQ